MLLRKSAEWPTGVSSAHLGVLVAAVVPRHLKPAEEAGVGTRSNADIGDKWTSRAVVAPTAITAIPLRARAGRAQAPPAFKSSVIGSVWTPHATVEVWRDEGPPRRPILPTRLVVNASIDVDGLTIAQAESRRAAEALAVAILVRPQTWGIPLTSRWVWVQSLLSIAAARVSLVHLVCDDLVGHAVPRGFHHHLRRVGELSDLRHATHLLAAMVQVPLLPQ
mmetsp:Transcript_43930/g.124095  ORF Transcript_43930/g.124095 Transcript_43930/m.124095 type:complete len:221 (-) Transcript_43930:330-992(-)